MAITVNQVLAICLVLVLIGFVAVLGVMAANAIGLIKRSKDLVETGNEIAKKASVKVDEVSGKVTNIVDEVADNTGLVSKALVGTGAGLAAFVVGKFFVKAALGRVGFVNSFVASRERKKAAKEIELSRETIKAVNKQAKREREAFKKAGKQSKKIQKKEAKAAAKMAKVSKKTAKKLAKAEKKQIKKAKKAAKRK